MKSKIINVAGAAILTLSLAVPAFAQVGISGSVKVNANANAGINGNSIRAGLRDKIFASTTHQGGMSTTTMQERMQNGQNRGTAELTARINILNNLSTRIQAMKNLSDSQKASFVAEIQTEITSLTSLQAKIQSDTSTTSLQADLKLIAPDYRIYLLVKPQLSLLSAVDRIGTLVTSLQTVQGKIQTRISADATLSGNATISADIADMTAKLADANTQANAASTEIVSLQPDQGNATIEASNAAAIKDARTKIQTAQKDLDAARKDARDIVNIIVSSDKTLMGDTNIKVSGSASSTTH